MKKSYPLEKKRAKLTSTQVDNWFQLLNKIIQENDLTDCPAQTFNSDELDEHKILIQIMDNIIYFDFL